MPSRTIVIPVGTTGSREIQYPASGRASWKASGGMS